MTLSRGVESSLNERAVLEAVRLARQPLYREDAEQKRFALASLLPPPPLFFFILGAL